MINDIKYMGLKNFFKYLNYKYIYRILDKWESNSLWNHLTDK